MGKVNSILSERLLHSDRPSKMEALAERSINGQLTSFSGIFGTSTLSTQEELGLRNLLEQFSADHHTIEADLKALSALTSEVKAINNQAAILHGERIKKAQQLLTKYRDGAFTAWLFSTYGNRQTPYNFLQYYEFHSSIPHTLHKQLESMPRQAIYTLASREGSFEKKRQIVEAYKGETKQALLERIREHFPLSNTDQRRQDHGELAIASLEKVLITLNKNLPTLSSKQKSHIARVLRQIQTLLAV